MAKQGLTQSMTLNQSFCGIAGRLAGFLHSRLSLSEKPKVPMVLPWSPIIPFVAEKEVSSKDDPRRQEKRAAQLRQLASSYNTEPRPRSAAKSCQTAWLPSSRKGQSPLAMTFSREEASDQLFKTRKRLHGSLWPGRRRLDASKAKSQIVRPAVPSYEPIASEGSPCRAIF